MAAAYDFLVNDDYGLVFKEGDLAIGESDQQHIQDTIQSFAGEWKEFPTDGVGVLKYYNGTGIEQKLARVIKLQLSLDGYDFTRSPRVYYTNNELIVEPNAIRR